MLKLSDQLQAPTGKLCYEVRRGGVLIETVEECNLIVDNSKQIHAKLLGGSVLNQSITQFAVGTNGVAPVGGNTAITTPFAKTVDAISYPAANQVQFNFSLAIGEANGMAILEFGLLTAGGVLYARRVRSVALNKDVDLSLAGTWTISF